MKTQHFLCCLALLAVCFTACKKDKEGPEIPTPVAVTGVTLNYEELTLVSGDTITLIATVKPDNADNKSVIWTSGNPEVVTVNDNGFVTALSEGIATIVVTTVDGNISANCTVKVSRHEIPVTDVTLNYEELSLIPGDTVTLIATVQPDNADNKTVTWTSSNLAVATVTDDGLVEAIADGKTIITVSTKDGNKTATCVVTVDYRTNWVGSYDCEEIRTNKVYQTIIDVTAKEDSILYFFIRRWGSGGDAKVNIDGIFEEYFYSGVFRGSFIGDSLNIHYFEQEGQGGPVHSAVFKGIKIKQ